MLVIPRAGHDRPTTMLLTGSPRIDADRAFTRARRERARAKVLAWVGRRMSSSRLPVFQARHERAGDATAAAVIREIPIDAIVGTVEPSRARLFDRRFRPARASGARWQRIWIAEHRGVRLPPISVVRVPGGYAVRDGHHRVSVARARGASTIDAVVG